jgi:hypothetical protein
MILRWRGIIMRAVVATYLLCLGFLAGVLVERMRFDHARSAILARFEAATAKLHDRLMTLEHGTEVQAKAE